MNQKLTFVNPYNFIPFKDKSDKVPQEEEKVLSGVINYTVLTKTPLFIANTSTDKAFSVKTVFGERDEKIDVGDASVGEKAKKSAEIKEEHKRYDFFSYNKLEEGSEDYYMPVIPGSEIRGMFRNQYEILTSSCLSGFDDVLLSKRTAEVFKAGLIKKTTNGYELYKADDCLWRTKGANNTTDIDKWDINSCYNKKSYIQSGKKEGEKVSFFKLEREKGKPLARLEKPTNEDADHYFEWQSVDSEEGYILKGEDGPEMKYNRKTSPKHNCHIFTVTCKVVKEDLDISCLDEVLKVYKNNSESGDKYAYKEYGTQWEKFKHGEGEEYFPVYYSEGTKGIIYLSPASITREVYKNKLKQMIRNLAPCSYKKGLCPACSLFGTITEKREAVASRIRFSDLKMVSNINSVRECYDSVVTLQPLSSPKISNTEFYVKRPAKEAIFWTYDYYIDNKHNIHPIEKPELNGRKFYWHNMSVERIDQSSKVTKLNMTIRPVKKGVVFAGQLFFDRISEIELERLIWILNAGEDGEITEKKHGYKLGAAKPLGLGSIAVRVDDVRIRKIAFNETGIIYETQDYKYAINPDNLFQSDIVSEFKIMNGFDSVPDELRISYPVVPGQKEGDEGFVWFTNNHVAVKNNDKDNKYPNKRKEQAFAYFLSPLNQELQYTNSLYKKFYEGRIESSNSSNFQQKSSYNINTNSKKITYMGRIKCFYKNKQYGFIEVEGGEDVFVHISNIVNRNVNDIRIGCVVSFEKEKNRKNNRTQAVNCRFLDE